MMGSLGVSRNTAIKYLDELVKIGILSKAKLWKENYYVNKDLYDFLANVTENIRCKMSPIQKMVTRTMS